MTGFIRGLFNKNKADDIETSASSETGSKDANAFFLDADSAKTFGDIDYMRTPKAVKKSFPKMGDSKEGAEMEEVVSSMVKGGEAMGEAAKSSPKMEKVEVETYQPPKEIDRRMNTDTSMDMFRNMAKDIKKK
jgi:hypothetical protein